MRVLDHGFITLIRPWGSDEEIVEAARMSTGKGFLGWGPKHADDCSVRTGTPVFIRVGSGPVPPGECPGCTPKAGDEKLLATLWNNRHTTPFEQCGMTIEVQAPIMVFREWHRHRTQSYNEFSARYSQMPNLHYVPTLQRIKDGVARAGANKQAQGVKPLACDEKLLDWLERIEQEQQRIYTLYEEGLDLGIPKEIARIDTPVSRYSKMRASGNLLNWLRFLGLRDAPDAQWEIRQYAVGVASFVKEAFPRTYDLFVNKRL
jgi:thymidylate synthase (FAD)